MRYITWSIVNFDTIWFIALILATFLIFKSKFSLGSKILYVFLMASGIIVITPLPEWGMTCLENRFQRLQKFPENVKGVIIIGGIVDRKISKTRGEPSFNMFGSRMLSVLKLMHERPQLEYIIMGGGRPFIENYQEADILVRYLEFIKPKLGKLMFDNISSTTVESAQVSYNMIKPKPGERWVLLTSAYHMPRAVGIFRKAGWDIIPYPVDFHTSGKYEWHLNFSVWWGFMMWSISTYEMLMNAVSYMNGESDALLPSDQNE